MTENRNAGDEERFIATELSINRFMFPSPAATRTIQRDCNKESTMISESATILIVE